MSMENPKGDQGALVLGAVEVAGEEGDNVVQFELWPGRRIWFVCRWRGHRSGDGLRGQRWLLSVYSLFIRLNDRPLQVLCQDTRCSSWFDCGLRLDTILMSSHTVSMEYEKGAPPRGRTAGSGKLT